MRSYEIEALEAGKTHGAVREDADAASPDLAARAAMAGRTEALAPAAVLRLQRAAGNAGVAAALENEQESPVKSVIGKGSGQPLEAPVRQRMEASFGADFSDVRVHSDGSAAASAQALDAHAYTVGNEIVLGDGQTPGSPAHERTLAHELTHVVQQRSGPVDGTPRAGNISVSDPADRFERAAESTADAVVSTGRAPDAVAGEAGGSSVQRERQEEEPEEAAGPDMTAETAQAGPDMTAETAQAGATEGAGLEELEELQELAIQREAAPEEEDEQLQPLAIQRIREHELENPKRLR